MTAFLAALLLAAIPAGAQTLTTLNENLWATNNAFYLDTNTNYLVLGGSATIPSNLGFSASLTGIHWADGSITTSAASGIGGSGPTGPQGPAGSNGATGPQGVSNFTGTTVASYILISTNSTTYAVMTQNTDGTVSLSTSATTTATYDIISYANALAWVSADVSSASNPALWQVHAPANPFTVGTMAMYDANGVSWSFTVDSDGVYRTTRLGGF